MQKNVQWTRDEYLISTDKKKLDIAFIHSLLTTTSWAEGISLETVSESIENSLCFGLYKNIQPVGFSRFVTDYTTFAYLCDVFISPDFQGHGLGRWLMECCLEHSSLKKLRRIMLVTSDASWLYQKTGYLPVNKDNFVWHIVRPNIYKSELLN